MWFKKRKKALFGANIEESCKYCRQNGAKAEAPPLCVLRLTPKDGKCKKYRYDPLRREPKASPALRTERYSEEDFKL